MISGLPLPKWLELRMIPAPWNDEPLNWIVCTTKTAAFKPPRPGPWNHALQSATANDFRGKCCEPLCSGAALIKPLHKLGAPTSAVHMDIFWLGNQPLTFKTMNWHANTEFVIYLHDTFRQTHTHTQCFGLICCLSSLGFLHLFGSCALLYRQTSGSWADSTRDSPCCDGDFWQRQMRPCNSVEFRFSSYMAFATHWPWL